MRARTQRRAWFRSPGRDAAVLVVLGAALASLAGAAHVRAEGRPSGARRPAVPARTADASACAPLVTFLSSATAPAAGGIRLTIQGANFLAAGAPPTVRFGFAPVAPESASDKRLVVTVPPQRDADDASVTVACPDGRVSPPAAFAYDAPSVSFVSGGDTASYGRGTVITITGSNFTCSNPRAWLDDGAGGTAECDVLDADDTTLVVSLPDWDQPAGTLRAGVVHRDVAARNFLFAGPQLTGVTPASWAATGGAVLTLTGSNFVHGAEGARVRLLRGGRRIEAPVVLQTPTLVTCTVPPMLDGGTGLEPVGVCVETAGRKSRTYQGQVDQDVASARRLSPSAGAAAGGPTITIVGENFRQGAMVRAGTADPTPATIVDATHLTFDLPALAPGTYDVTVEQDGTSSPPLSLDVLPAPELVSVSPPVVPIEGGTVLTITGANFGLADFGLSRRVAVGQNGKKTDVGPVRWMAPEVLRVVAPPGSTGPADVTVEIDGARVTLAGAFSYGGTGGPPAPSVTSLSPPELSVAGGNVITISGSHFAPDTSAHPQVIFGSTAVTPSSVSDVELVFVQPPLPAGQAQNPIYVDRGGQGSSPLYGNRASPSLDAPASGTACRAGGAVLTIVGRDFSADARVRFGAGDGTTLEVAPLSVGPTSLVLSAPEVSGHPWTEVTVVDDGLVSNPQPYALTGPALTGVSTRELAPGGGTVITLTGSGFGAAPRLEIDGEAAHVREYDPAQDQLKSKPRHRVGPPGVAIRVVDESGQASDSLQLRWMAPEVLSPRTYARREGAGGGAITIVGLNFGPGAAVTLAGPAGGESPPIVDRGPTELVVRPAASAPGAYAVEVVDPDLGAAAAGLLERLAPPTVTQVVPAAPPVEGGVPLTLTGTNFGDPAADVARSVHLSGFDCPLELLPPQADRIVCLLPPGTGTHDLVVTVDGVADTIPGALTYGGTTDVPAAAAVPRALALAAGPSPFRGELALLLALPGPGSWRLELFDARGARVRGWEGESAPGTFPLAWDGRDAAGAPARPGVYFARLTAGGAQRIVRAVKLE